MSRKAIGIDLGTTNSCVAIYSGGQPKVIENKSGKRTTPSWVSFAKNGDILVGEVAKRQAVIDPENTVFGAKRLIGRKFSEIASEVKDLPFKVEADSHGYASIEIRGKKYPPAEIGAMILRDLKESAEAYLGETVTDAVITVPAYFNDQQRQATKDAGAIAGLNVGRIINEPTAAAMAYGIGEGTTGTIVVYDLGGGTFDVSVIEVDDGVFEVKATNGDTRLGGEDFDQCVINWIAEEYKKKEGEKLNLSDPLIYQRVKEEAENKKKDLSSQTSVEINLPFIAMRGTTPVNFQVQLNRAKLDDLTRHLVNRSIEPCRKVLQDAKISNSEITELILVGGMTRMPAVQEQVEKFFGKKPKHGINPDEAVAMGAAIQAAVLTGDIKDVVLLDVTPLSLGIETLGGVFTKIIERNTTIPTRKSQIFSTAEDNQSGVSIKVLQGEREMASDNQLLGQFELVGIPPARRGMPQIEVSFDIDTNGIAHVSAQDKSTGKKQNVQIDPRSKSMSKEEIEEKIREAEMHAEEDKKKRESIELVNQVDGVISTTERNLTEHGDKISQEERESIDTALKKCKDAKEGGDDAQIKSSMEQLIHKSSKLMEESRKADDASQSQDDDNSTGQSSEEKSDQNADQAEDGDFTEHKE